eukprot:6487510-Amphidinium_carterae.1
MKFAEEIFEGKPDYPTQAALRGLCFEMFAIIAAEMQLATGSSSADAPKRLATSERVERKKRQQERLAGLSLRGNWEPSDSLVDLCVAMHDENRAKWLPWSKLTKQQQEITADRSDPTLVVEQGVLKQKPGLKDVEAD